MNQEPLLRWQAHEYPLKKRKPDWYWALGILTIAFLTVAILLKNFLFAVLIVISALLLTLFSIRRPSIVTFEIFEKGIVVHKSLYLFKDLDSYNVTQTHPPKLLLQSKRLLAPITAIPLENVAPAEVVTLLREHLPEKELQESLALQLLERLGF